MTFQRAMPRDQGCSPWRFYRICNDWLDIISTRPTPRYRHRSSSQRCPPSYTTYSSQMSLYRPGWESDMIHMNDEALLFTRKLHIYIRHSTPFRHLYFSRSSHFWARWFNGPLLWNHHQFASKDNNGGITPSKKSVSPPPISQPAISFISNTHENTAQNVHKVLFTKTLPTSPWQHPFHFSFSMAVLKLSPESSSSLILSRWSFRWNRKTIAHTPPTIIQMSIYIEELSITIHCRVPYLFSEWMSSCTQWKRSEYKWRDHYLVKIRRTNQWL